MNAKGVIVVTAIGAAVVATWFLAADRPPARGALRSSSESASAASRTMEPAAIAAPAPSLLAPMRELGSHALPGAIAPVSSVVGESRPALPGTYVPKGFAPDFRARIVSDFSQLIDEKLGNDFPPDKRAKIAEAQSAYWDAMGPSVDALNEHAITQPEFADRTHQALNAYASSLASTLTDAEYVKLMDSPKGVDPYSLLYHSADEQPGMPMRHSEYVPRGADPTEHGPTPGEPYTPPGVRAEPPAGTPEPTAVKQGGAPKPGVTAPAPAPK